MDWFCAIAASGGAERLLREPRALRTADRRTDFGSTSASAACASAGSCKSAGFPRYPRALRTAVGSDRAQASISNRGVILIHLAKLYLQRSCIAWQYAPLLFAKAASRPRPPASAWMKRRWKAERAAQASAATACTVLSDLPIRSAGLSGTSTSCFPPLASLRITRGIRTSKYSESLSPS